MRSLLLLVGLVIVCAVAAQTGAGQSALSDVGLYQKPASYTELSFSTPGNLPSALPSSNSPIHVSFSIHNVSAARDYQWSIVLTRSGQSHVKASGTVAAPAQGRVTVTKTVTMKCVGGQLEVTARLASPAESIHFLVTCPSAHARAR